MAEATLDWKDEARSLHAQGLSSAEIAAAVDKHPATVRKVLQEPAPDVLAAEESPNGRATIEAQAGPGEGDTGLPPRPTPGQQTIDGREIPQELPPEEIVIPGTTQLGFFDVGGKKPQTASIRFVGGKVTLERGTAFKKGEVIHFEGYAQVVEASPRDKRDRQTRQVVDCELQIRAEIDDLKVVRPTA